MIRGCPITASRDSNPTSSTPPRRRGISAIRRVATLGPERRRTGLLVVGLWTGLVVANFVWLWPILMGLPLTPQMWDAQLWLPSWRQ